MLQFCIVGEPSNIFSFENYFVFLLLLAFHLETFFSISNQGNDSEF